MIFLNFSSCSLTIKILKYICIRFIEYIIYISQYRNLDFWSRKIRKWWDGRSHRSAAANSMESFLQNGMIDRRRNNVRPQERCRSQVGGFVRERSAFRFRQGSRQRGRKSRWEPPTTTALCSYGTWMYFEFVPGDTGFSRSIRRIPTRPLLFLLSSFIRIGHRVDRFTFYYRAKRFLDATTIGMGCTIVSSCDGVDWNLSLSRII